MSQSQVNAALHHLLVELDSGLLQYVGESWPWTPDTSSSQKRFTALVERQKADIGELVELLQERRWTVNFVGYPTDYTDLHYCSLEYLVRQTQRALTRHLESIRRTLDAVRGDAEAVDVVSRILADHESIESELKSLAASYPQGAAA